MRSKADIFHQQAPCRTVNSLRTPPIKNTYVVMWPWATEETGHSPFIFDKTQIYLSERRERERQRERDCFLFSETKEKHPGSSFFVSVRNQKLPVQNTQNNAEKRAVSLYRWLLSAVYILSSGSVFLSFKIIIWI